jgi:hypothetical protein
MPTRSAIACVAPPNQTRLAGPSQNLGLAQVQTLTGSGTSWGTFCNLTWRNPNDPDDAQVDVRAPCALPCVVEARNPQAAVATTLLACC